MDFKWSHFYSWIDHYGATFLQELLDKNKMKFTDWVALEKFIVVSVSSEN